MLTELEKRLMGQGVHRLSALLAEEETGVKAFHNCGYEQRDLTYFERVVPLQPQEVGLLGELGGRILPGGLWEALAGMEHEKEVIERRIVLPLVDPDLADEYGVQPPRAVVLFGPPGTGKTTFAKAVSSRLGWPFVEVFPSRLAAAGDGQALALRDTFAEIDELEHAVVFIDEVEEIAGPARRQAAPAAAGRDERAAEDDPDVPRARRPAARLRDQLRPRARPGLPAPRPLRLRDPRRRAGRRRARGDLAALPARRGRSNASTSTRSSRPASCSPRPTSSSRRARAHSARSRSAVYGDERDRPEVRGPATADYLAALAETRPTLTTAIVDEFTEDIAAIARL